MVSELSVTIFIGLVLSLLSLVGIMGKYGQSNPSENDIRKAIAEAKGKRDVN